MDNKQTEQRAHAFEHLFEAALITDPGGAILDCNPSAEKVFGYLFEELAGQSVSMLIADDEAEKIAADILTWVEKHGTWKGELHKMGKKNRVGVIDVIAAPITAADGTFQGATWLCRDITDQILLEKRVAALEYYDPLTKIPNRLVMYDRLQQLISTARRNQLMFALFFVDLDNFHAINDTAGYVTGDAVLCEVAERMKSVLRQSDTVSRVGGDEFIVLASDIRQERDAALIKENILSIFKGVFIVGEHEFTLSASIGVVIYPRDGESSDDLLIKADRDMEREKFERLNPPEEEPEA